MSQYSASEVYISSAKKVERVNPNTVEQFIGEVDSDNKLIFEGDLLKDSDGDVWVVRYSTKYRGFVMKLHKGNFILCAWEVNFNDYLKVGNIHNLEEW